MNVLVLGRCPIRLTLSQVKTMFPEEYEAALKQEYEHKLEVLPEMRLKPDLPILRKLRSKHTNSTRR